MPTATPTTAIQNALDVLLSEIRQHNPKVPDALAVTIGTGKGKYKGYFLADAWKDNGGEHEGEDRHEIVMAPESFINGAHAVTTTLIHETAHALAHATGVKDTTRQGRYHNGQFRRIAEEMGLVTEPDSKIGAITTGLQVYASDLYADAIQGLADALITYRIPAKSKATKPKTTLRIQCECEVPVTVPIKWWDEFGHNNLKCSLCGDFGNDEYFHPVSE